MPLFTITTVVTTHLEYFGHDSNDFNVASLPYLYQLVHKKAIHLATCSKVYTSKHRWVKMWLVLCKGPTSAQYMVI